MIRSKICVDMKSQWQSDILRRKKRRAWFNHAAPSYNTILIKRVWLGKQNDTFYKWRDTQNIRICGHVFDIQRLLLTWIKRCPLSLTTREVKWTNGYFSLYKNKNYIWFKFYSSSCLAIFEDISLFIWFENTATKWKDLIFFSVFTRKGLYLLLSTFPVHSVWFNWSNLQNNLFMFVDIRLKWVDNFIWCSYQIEKNTIAYVQCVYIVWCALHMPMNTGWNGLNLKWEFWLLHSYV